MALAMLKPDATVDAALLGPTPARRKRIFWFGAHKILVKTELRRLRSMGYEVFMPPYLSNVDDQSAFTGVDVGQNSTLPRDVLRKLSRYNFFYNSIDEEIAEIINFYFDAAIVTILGRWAAELARAFNGPILYRAYGQTGLLSEDFERLGMREALSERANFHFMPHAQECGDLEQDWLRAKMRVVPYTLADDVFEREGSWVGSEGASPYILISAPNVANIFHNFHYRFLKKHFYQDHYRFVGVQTKQVWDPQVLGTLSLDALIEQFRKASGYLYTYSDPRVCYLPPIEMMAYRGPVIYLSGSLLARYFEDKGPGECATIDEAHAKSRRLLQGDRAFVRDLQDAQEDVVKRYHPKWVGPIFEAAITDILGSPIADVRPPSGAKAMKMAPDTLDDLSRLIARDVVSALASRPEAEENVSLDAVVSQLLGSGEFGPPPAASAALHEYWNGATADDPAATWGAVDILNYPGSSYLVGHPARDERSGASVREARVGQSGFLAYGPYMSIAKGGHVVHFTLDLEGTAEQTAVIVDVSAGGTVLAGEAIQCGPGRSSHRHMLRFTTEGATDSVEFRVITTGAAWVRLKSIIYDHEI